MNPRARRRITLALALAAFAVVAASAFVTTRQGSASSAPTSVPAPASRTPTVAMIGDSVTYAAVPTLAREFEAAGWDADIEAHPGDLFRDRQAIAEQLASRNPDVVVINLGTNDELCIEANQPGSGLIPCRFPAFEARDVTDDMTAMVDLFPVDRTCVVGVLPTSAPGATALWRFRELAGGVTGLADWGGESRAHLEVLWDPVGHLSEIGLERYATFITSEVRRICGPKLDAVAAG